jgi:1-acyl-sn-glycerol-3-phosphate acyltransferase
LLIFRSCIFHIFLVIYTCTLSCIFLLLFPFKKNGIQYYLAKSWSRHQLLALKYICNLTFCVINNSKQSDLKHTKVVAIANHQSTWETIALLSIFDKKISYVFKRELLWLPFFGWAISMLEMIKINRANKKEAMTSIITQGQALLNKGVWVVIFPQGTRVPVGKKSKFMAGGARLAHSCGAHILPLAHNAGTYWAKNNFIIYPGVITVSLGDLIDSTDKSSLEIHELATNWITHEMQRIHA